MPHRAAKTTSIMLTLCCSFLLHPAASFSKANPTGKEIMEKVDQRDEGEDQVSRSVQQLINDRGQKRLRDSIRIKKNYKGKNGFDAKTIIFMKSPPQVKGTAVLMWSYLKKDKDDDQWLYLPALRKVRRLSASDKEDSFMGTDFTYDDMGDRKVKEDRHRLLKSEVLKGKDCYVVVSVPKDKGYMYSKKVSWIVKGKWLPLKVEFYDRKKRRLKTQTFSRWKKIKAVWTVGKIEMSNHLTGHRTILDTKQVKVNVGVPDATFKERTLKKGLRKAYF
jgi:outer membrane lipoprotein-sorting protein